MLSGSEQGVADQIILRVGEGDEVHIGQICDFILNTYRKQVYKVITEIMGLQRARRFPSTDADDNQLIIILDRSL